VLQVAFRHNLVCNVDALVGPKFLRPALDAVRKLRHGRLQQSQTDVILHNPSIVARVTLSVKEGERKERRFGQASHTGISLFTSVGVAVAVQISWAINHSIGWAVWHGLLGWIYVIYRWIVGVPG